MTNFRIEVMNSRAQVSLYICVRLMHPCPACKCKIKLNSANKVDVGKFGHVVEIARLSFAVHVTLNREIKIQVYAKRKTSDSS